jgi:hypothetical protein
MKIHQIHDDTDHHVMGILKQGLAQITAGDIARNYHPENNHITGNLFYILAQSDNRYKHGCYYVLEKDGEYVCSAGWNEYELDRTIALVLTRAYVAPKYRSHFYMAEYLLPLMLEAVNPYETVYITSNAYNSTIYEAFVRGSQGLTTGWPEIYKKFTPIGQQTIYYTLQNVVRLNK